MSGDSGTSTDGPKTPQGVFYSKLPHLVNATGQYLFCKYWHPQGQEPRALLMLVHGAAEHCGRCMYEEIARDFNKEGILVFAHDHIGHGQSEGCPVDVTCFDEYVRDVLQHADKVRAEHPGIRLFVLGHSMGGAITTIAVLERPTLFTGVVLSAPATIHVPQFNTLKCKAYEDDPLVWHGGLGAPFLMRAYDATERIRRDAASFQPPPLALHGDQDKMTFPEGTKFLYENAAAKDKQITIYPGLYHEILHEAEAEMIRQDIVTWVTERI